MQLCHNKFYDNLTDTFSNTDKWLYVFEIQKVIGINCFDSPIWMALDAVLFEPCLLDSVIIARYQARYLYIIQIYQYQIF